MRYEKTHAGFHVPYFILVQILKILSFNLFSGNTNKYPKPIRLLQ